MSPRLLRWLVQAALLVGLVLHVRHGLDRLSASRWLVRVEVTSREFYKMGPAAGPLLRRNLDLLKVAEQQDPLEPGIPIAIGAVHQLLGSPHAALEPYERALAIEWRPEAFLNLGRAQRRSGRHAEARESFQKALKLDGRLVPEIEAELKAMETPPLP